MRPIIEFYEPQASSNKPQKTHNNSPFNAIFSVILIIMMIYLLIKGFIWAWSMLSAWETL